MWEKLIYKAWCFVLFLNLSVKKLMEAAQKTHHPVFLEHFLCASHLALADSINVSTRGGQEHSEKINQNNAPRQWQFGIWSCARHRHFFEAPSRSSNHWIINQQISRVFVTQGQPNFQISALHCEANQNKAKNCALATVSVFRSSLDRYRLGCSGKGGMLKVYTTYYNLGGDRFRSNRRTKNHLILPKLLNQDTCEPAPSAVP